MDGTIIVVPDEVDTLMQMLLANIQNDLTEARNRYTEIAEGKKQIDGKSNASLITATELNLEKTTAVYETLEKLLIYIGDASQEVRDKDNEMSGQLLAGS